MKIPRFYQEDYLEKDSIVDLSTKNHRHAIQVLRLKVGDSLILFNGKGGESHAHVTVAAKRHSSVQIDSCEHKNTESPLDSTLVLALIKPDKMDFAIQKAVELGVSMIQPMYTKRSIVNIKADRLDKKMQHWLGIIIAACEQSGRTFIPNINEPSSFDSCLADYSEHHCISMLPGDYPQISDLKLSDIEKGIALFIGPEGGFTDQEESLILEKKLNSVSFGPRILRAETAVVAGLTACQESWGDI